MPIENGIGVGTLVGIDKLDYVLVGEKLRRFRLFWDSLGMVVPRAALWQLTAKQREVLVGGLKRAYKQGWKDCEAEGKVRHGD